MTRLITLQLIETEEKYGIGTKEDPCRIVRQLYTPEGSLVLEYDDYHNKTSMVGNLLVHLNWIP